MPEIAPVPGVWATAELASRTKAIVYAARKVLSEGVVAGLSFIVFLEQPGCIEPEYEEAAPATCYPLVIYLSRCMPGPPYLEKKSRERLPLRSIDRAEAEIHAGRESACERDASRAPRLSPRPRDS